MTPWLSSSRSSTTSTCCAAPPTSTSASSAVPPRPRLTEFLAHLAGDVEVAMMLATGQLRVVLVTTHIALKDVPAQLTTERIVRCGRITERALATWWGIARPRLALCALNPHAGESGLFGDEDQRIGRPAAAQLAAPAPLPPHTLFLRALRREFPTVLP